VGGHEPRGGIKIDGHSINPGQARGPCIARNGQIKNFYSAERTLVRPAGPLTAWPGVRRW
jgi:hypothetical protein